MKQSYERYVGEENAKKILDDEIPVVDGEETEVTVLLADVRSFTSYSEDHGPQDVIDILNTYFNPIVKTVFEFGGAIDKFMGDCVMAIFGAPATELTPKYDHHALTAVECALECRRRVRDLSDQRKKQELETLKVGYTLNSGDAVAGHFGSEQRQDYSVIGDMVNTCARIEKFVEGDGILVGQNTYTLVRDDVRAEKKPVRSVKGKEQVVHVYEILELLEE